MPETPSLLYEIEAAIADGTPRQRLRALKRICDLFVAGSSFYTSEQIAVFDDVLLKLSAVIETEARVKLARRLASLADAPPKMIRSLAFDPAIEVAGPVLAHSQRLTEPDLVENANTQSQAHLYAISKRSTLSEAVTDVLVDRGDRRVARSVAENGGARFSEAGYGRLVMRANGDDTLAECLGLRHDIPRHHFLKLLQTASAAVREKLAAANPGAAAAVRNVVAEVAGKISRKVRESSTEFHKAKAATKRRHKTSQLTEQSVHSAAASQQFEKAVAALALLGHFPVDLVERGLLDKNPDIVLILAKAAGCSRTTAKALLRMRDADRGMSALDVEAALTSFERLSTTAARRVIAYYTNHYADDAVRARAKFSESFAAVA
jgi:uncharacterized protein (DUF2336 family)